MKRGSSRSATRRALKQGLDEFVGVEFFQIVDSFPHADVSDRNLELFRDPDDDPPFCRSIQFGEGDSGHADRFVKELGLGDGILTGGGIEDEKDLVGSSWAFSV